jgi:hypothetical protein
MDLGVMFCAPAIEMARQAGDLDLRASLLENSIQEAENEFSTCGRSALGN